MAVDKNSNEEKGETHKSFRSLDRVLVSVRHRKRGNVRLSFIQPHRTSAVVCSVCSEISQRFGNIND